MKKCRYSERFPGVEFGEIQGVYRVLVLVDKTIVFWKEDGRRRRRTFLNEGWLFQID